MSRHNTRPFKNGVIGILNRRDCLTVVKKTAFDVRKVFQMARNGHPVRIFELSFRRYIHFLNCEPCSH